MKKRIFQIAAFVTMFIPAAALAYKGYCDGSGYGYGGRGSWHHMWGYGGFFGGGIFMLIITTVLLGVLIFFGVQYFKQNRLSGSDDALNIARNRFASGEISKEEFETIKSGL